VVRVLKMASAIVIVIVPRYTLKKHKMHFSGNFQACTAQLVCVQAGAVVVLLEFEG
jgi:hypothetical protein